MTEANLSNRGALHIGKTVVSEVRKVQSRMEAQTIEILMLIAESPNISQKDLQKHVGINLGSVGRNLDLLGDGNARSEGLGYVVRYDDPADRRTKRVKLTKAGEKWLQEYTEALRRAVGQATAAKKEA